MSRKPATAQRSTGVCPWYCMYPADFLQGTVELTCEEVGAYIIVLNLTYQHNRPIADSDRWIAQQCRLSTYRWRQIRGRLIELGKLEARDGLLVNPRAEREMNARAAHVEARRAAGSRGGKVRRTPPPPTPENPPFPVAASQPDQRVSKTAASPDTSKSREFQGAVARQNNDLAQAKAAHTASRSGNVPPVATKNREKIQTFPETSPPHSEQNQRLDPKQDSQTHKSPTVSSESTPSDRPASDIQHRKDISLREMRGEPAAPEPPEDAVTPNQALFQVWYPLLCEASAKFGSQRSAKNIRDTIGMSLSRVGGDAMVVMQAIRVTLRDERGDPVKYFLGLIARLTDKKKLGSLDTIRDDWNLPSFLTPRFDPEPDPSGQLEYQP